jgi:hypothetical protein
VVVIFDPENQGDPLARDNSRSPFQYDMNIPVFG